MNGEPQIAVYCQPCKERRATESPARHFPGGTPMCDSCFGGRSGKAREEKMSKKIEIDMEKLKALHAQHLSDRAIGERLGVSGATILVRRHQLGLPPGARGRRGPGRGQAAKSPSAGKRSKIASAGGDFQRWRKAGVAGTATIHLSPTGLDRLWNALSLETKTDCINKVLST